MSQYKRSAGFHRSSLRPSLRPSLIETLETRALLAGAALPTVDVVSTFTNASESHRTTTGRGEYVFKRPTGNTSQPLVVKYAINGDSTATNGVDFETLSGKVTIPAGKRSVAINVFPINDSADEPTEQIILSIKNQSAYKVGHRSAVVRIADNDPPVVTPPDDTTGWWDTDYHYRAPITVNVGSFGRSDKTVEQSINFTSLLTAHGDSGSLITDSIRVIETSADGHTVTDANVPVQFDQASSYNAATNASGTLVFVAKGSTSASTTRHYHVYFDTAGTFSPFNFTAQITTDANNSDQGQNAFRINTLTADYWLQKENGGFSSIEDKSGNDWLGFNPTPNSQSGGEFRGTPNSVFPGGGFHAGFNIGSSAIVTEGPLKTTIDCTMSVDKQEPGAPFTYKMRYEFYGDHVVATMTQAGDSYWFLYEGTPGGAVDSNDSVVRSDGTTTDISTSWTDNDGVGTGNGQEWVYFRDSAVDKHMYFVHDTPDNQKDSYYRMDANGSMTVFGFGRNNDGGEPELMNGQNRFTFGIADGGGNFNAASSAINGVYRPVTLTTGVVSKLS